jgi:hypothetical protein
MSALTLSPLSSSRNSFWIFDANGHACTGNCDSGWAMDQDGFWRCDHGQWRVLSEAPSSERPHHANACPGHCRQHPLVDDLVRLFLTAEDMGLTWGDIMMEEDDRARAAETPAERTARLDRQAAEERRTAAAIKASELAKVEAVVAGMRKVEPSAKSMHPCHRTGLKPCRYFCQDGILGKAAPAQRDPRSGMLWPAGCAPHLKKRCEFFHPDEPEWALIMAGKTAQVDRTGGRDFSALVSRPSSSARPSSGGSGFSGCGSGRV